MCNRMYIYRVRHIKCYRAIALKLLIISKNVSDKSFSVREGHHTGPPYFLSVEALKLRQGQLHFFKGNHVFFFDDIVTDFKTNPATSITQGHSTHLKKSFKKVELYIFYIIKRFRRHRRRRVKNREGEGEGGGGGRIILSPPKAELF